MSPDAAWLVLQAVDSSASGDIIALPLKGSGDPLPIAVGAADQRNGMFSPDGRFITYESDESGRHEVYIVPFPPTGARYQVSPKGGAQALWRSDGGEIYYIDPENFVTALPVQVSDGVPQFGTPQRLFQIYASVGNLVRWDPAPGGQRFLVTVDVKETKDSPIVLVTDWVKTLGK